MRTWARPALAVLAACVAHGYLATTALRGPLPVEDSIGRAIGFALGPFTVSGLIAAVVFRTTGNRSTAVRVWWFSALAIMAIVSVGLIGRNGG